MIDPLTSAIRYANRTEHGGQGYRLFISDTGGGQTEVSVYEIDAGTYALSVTDDPNGGRIFFNQNNIVSVRVAF